LGQHFYHGLLEPARTAAANQRIAIGE